MMEKEEIELWEPYPGHFIAIRGEWDKEKEILYYFLYRDKGAWSEEKNTVTIYESEKTIFYKNEAEDVLRRILEKNPHLDRDDFEMHHRCD